MSTKSPLVILFIMTFSLVSCSSDNADLYAWLDDVRSKHKPKVEPLPLLEPYEKFIYESSHLREPFEDTLHAQQEPTKSLAKSSNSGISPDLNRPREPLENFPLDALRMVGTMDQNGQIWAIVQAPDSTVSRISRGNYLGQNFGRIQQIEEHSVSLNEIIPDGLGGWIQREASISIVE